jgi:lipopolysaccharide/colanic/teichoic acid biosynthesis glycosyltransferase
MGLALVAGTVPTTAQSTVRAPVLRDTVPGHHAPVVPVPLSAREESKRTEGPRRALNIATALFGLVVAAPLMACIALLIRLTSRGPVLYMQTRVGLDRRSPRSVAGNGRRHRDHGGVPFTIYKFRTMRVHGHSTAQVWAQPDDPRVTPLGRVLRKYRLDELPQLFNVLRGDMNVVGPRPEQPRIFADLRQQIHGYDRRQRVRPGITGWAQINQHYDTSIDSVRRKVNYDLEYIARQSPLEDLRILLYTVPVVVFKRGAW